MTTTFSIRFKQCLKEKNIKQAELARSTKITPSSISDWSKGKYVPKRDKLLAIAEFLEVNPDWLVGESDNMEITPLPTSTNNHISEDTEELIDNISKLPILGTICAGDGVYIEEEYDEHIFIDQGMRADFALRVKGDSMIESIQKNKKGILLMLVSSICVCVGQLLWKLSATQGLIIMLAGFAFYGAGALIMIIAYKFGKLSVLQPMLSLNYVLSIVLAAFVLHEAVTLYKVIGVIVITCGVIMIAGGDE